MGRALEKFPPLLIIEFHQLELGGPKSRGLPGRLAERVESLLLAVIVTLIPRQQRLLILDGQLPFVHPDRHPLPGEPAFRRDGEARHTNTAIAMHRPQEVGPAKALL